MKAAVVQSGRGLAIAEVPVPEPNRDQLLVRVHAAGLNRADLGVAAGHAHGAMGGTGTIPGLEFAGEVVRVGEAAAGFAPGDRVMGATPATYAEYTVCDHGYATLMPEGMDFAEAATLPVALRTMHDAIVTNGAFRAGQSVMIQGASSGVGLMGLQIAKHLGAVPVIGTSTNPDRRARLCEFGADHALATTNPAWPDVVLKETGGRGVDLIVDQVSGAMTNATMRACAVRGRIVNVGRLGGARAEFDFDLHALRRITYVGVTFRTRSVEEIREIVRVMRADLWDAVAAGTLRLPIDRTFPLAEVNAALDHMRANAHLGKIVLLT
ncbi:MAG TPA: zinc-binding dehydrogenase [Acidisphaera sp.]|nr:zinc-binding dehydrogenase [Acidisphaera sp.]